MARAINPVNTMSDGDLGIAMSAAPPGGSAHATIDALGVTAADALVQATLRAVRMSPSLGGLAGLAK